MSVSVTGVVLSSILLEQANSACDKEGLLLGKVSNITTDTISDLSINNVQHRTVYYVYSFIPAEKLFSWYDKNGSVNEGALTDLLKDIDVKEVVGWYRLRRNSTLAISVRERSIHRHLQDWLIDYHKKPSINLLYFLCISQSTASNVPGGGGGLYTSDHQFLISKNSGFFSLPVTVMNLGNIAKPDYRYSSSIILSSGQSSFDRLMKKSRSRFVADSKELDSVKEIHALSGRLYNKLQELNKVVIESEGELAKELNEVKALRQKVQHSEEMLAMTRKKKSDKTVDVPQNIVSMQENCDSSEKSMDIRDVELIDLSDACDAVEPIVIEPRDSCDDDATQDLAQESFVPSEVINAGTPEQRQQEPFGFVSDLLKSYNPSPPKQQVDNKSSGHDGQKSKGAGKKNKSQRGVADDDAEREENRSDSNLAHPSNRKGKNV